MSALGQTLPIHLAPVPINVRYASNSDQIADEAECPLSAKSGHTVLVLRHRSSKKPRQKPGLLTKRERQLLFAEEVVEADLRSLSREVIFKPITIGRQHHFSINV